MTPRAADFPERRAAALQTLAEASLAERGPRRRRTRAVVILKDGAVAAEAYAPGFSAGTPLNGWSMTKSVMGALIGTLVKDGKLSLADRGLLPEWTGDDRSAISLEDLLRMSSGLNFSEIYADTGSDVNAMLFDAHDAGGYAAARPLESIPGTVWKYASGTTNILSLIARRAVGEENYPSWPRRALFDPLGMDSAVFETDATGTFIGSSFLFATARDWARFGLLYAEGGRDVLPAGWVKFSATPAPRAPNEKYGAHWWLKLSKELGGETSAAAAIPADAFHALGHEGQCLTVIPSRGLVVVRMGLSIDIKAWNHAEFLKDVLEAA
ncbi:MAG: beta-lactamase family protein [Elusimicrobiota bacterium]|nr:MAG: beta-lactamase family protein [Elusimicrobiota bacterium]